MKVIRQPISSIRFSEMSIGYTIDECVLRHVNFELPLGEIYWLMGDAGAGKSALLKIMAGLLQPPEGLYSLNNQSVYDFSFDQFTSYRLNIGYGFDMGGLLNNKTLFENLILPLEYHREISIEESKERVNNTLKYFDLLPMKNIRPAMVSGSIRKLTCTIRAFIQNPQLILLDDFTTGLSESHLNNMREWIFSYKKQHPKATILISTQDTQFMKSIPHLGLNLKRETGIELKSIKRAA